MARDRHHCRNCSSYRGPHLHHIKYREHGGGNDASNLAVLCSDCHSLAHSNKLFITRDPSSPDRLIFLDASGVPVTRRGARAPLPISHAS